MVALSKPPITTVANGRCTSEPGAVESAIGKKPVGFRFPSLRIAALLDACIIEPLLPQLARVAGEAIAAVKGATVVDAVVMASAASRGDRVLTSDFDDLDRLRSYFTGLRHNDEHQHSGLALLTPAEVFFGRLPAVHSVRQAALDAAYASHPERFPNGPPRAALPPASGHINPLEAMVVTVRSTAAVANTDDSREAAASPTQSAPRRGEDAATRGASSRNRSTSFID
jgi:hypothetical protein